MHFELSTWALRIIGVLRHNYVWHEMFDQFAELIGDVWHAGFEAGKHHQSEYGRAENYQTGGAMVLWTQQWLANNPGARKIPAIKAIRSRYGCGLREAKLVADLFEFEG